MSSSYAKQSGGHDEPTDKKPDYVPHRMENLPEGPTCDCRSDDHNNRTRIVGFTSPNSYDGTHERAEDHHRERRHERATEQVKRQPRQVEREKRVPRSLFDSVTRSLEPTSDDAA